MTLPMQPDSDVVAELLAPISATSPCGQSLRYDADFDRLRELRREDDATLPTGVWKAEVKRGDWSALEKLASDILRSRSKDLMVAAWLGEAWLQRNALEGLSQALSLIVGLCERYPEELHPLAEEGDQSWRVTPLDWLARRYAEVLHTRIPLFAASSGEFSTFTLYEWQQLQARQVAAADSKAAKAAAEAARLTQQKLNELIRDTPITFWLRCKTHLESGGQNLARLEQWSDACLADLAPTYSPLRDVMLSMTALLQEFIAMHPQRPMPMETMLAAPAHADDAAEEDATVKMNADAQSLSLNSREDAYRQLVLIADYLAKTEPHSPVPYLIKRAVEWGNKPLNELLTELISADSEARRVWSLLGVLK
ncbi:type VI secretion system protein TssA [Pseudomonas sp. UBA2684]|uniref:type VI secretion system protein TssA n=1 Tax=Pseudomonas sp. UBA2684 TaxID=1947311 RepID=UPI0025E858CA|nr:type VI secretion system protein TssA [Pseudomonas sp. UBA2684]